MSLLDVRNLKTHFFTPEGIVKAVDGVSFSLDEGESLGLVGESGCGKSTLGYSLMRLVRHPGSIVGGQIIFKGENLLEKDDEEMRKTRGSEISMIFQNPKSSLNPIFTIENQIGEAFEEHKSDTGNKIREKVIEILRKVGIPDPEIRMKGYPHQYSGGMSQRAMIAMSLAFNPSLLIADEPTTNLDVTIQAQILELMKKIRKEFSSSIILITHDLGVIAEMCDKVAIMYAGKIVEYADLKTIFKDPRHPYTIKLLNCVPKIESVVERFPAITGSVPNLIRPPSGCRFHPRCDFTTEVCTQKEPQPVEIKKGHKVYCFNYAETT